MSQTDQEIEELRRANRDLRQRMQSLEARMHRLAEEHAAVVDVVSRAVELDSGSGS